MTPTQLSPLLKLALLIQAVTIVWLAWRMFKMQGQINVMDCKLIAYRHYMALGGLFGQDEKRQAERLGENHVNEIQSHD